MTRLAPITPRTCVLLLLLLAGPAGALAQSVATARPHEKVLMVKPGAGAAGTTLVIRGISFGPRRGFTLMLSEEPSGSRAKPRQVELQILQWSTQEVRARIPELPWRGEGRFAIVLFDERKGAVARGAFRLVTPAEDAEGDGDRSSARLDRSVPRLDPNARPDAKPEPDPKSGSRPGGDRDRAGTEGGGGRPHEPVLVVKPNAGTSGTTLLIRGAQFGPRRSDLTLMLSEEPVSTHTKPRQIELHILDWRAQEVRARIPELPWRGEGRFAIVLVDQRKGPVARGAFTLATARFEAEGDGKLGSRPDRSGPQPGPKPDPQPKPDPKARPEPRPDSKLGSDSKPRPHDEPRPGDDRDRRSEDGGGDTLGGRPDPGPGLDPRGSRDRSGLPGGATGPLGDSPRPGRQTDPHGGPSARQRGLMQRTALVLQGGGALGAFQVGALKNLYARGLDPQIITGTSVGALNAAMLAEGRGVEGVADLERLWRNLDGNESIYVPNPQFAEVGADTLGAWKSWLSNLAGSVLLGSPGVPIVALDSPSIDGSVNELLTDIDAIESINLQDPLRRQVESHIDPRCVEASGIKVRMAAVARDSGDVRFFTETGDVETEDGRLLLSGRVDGPTVASGNGELLAPNLSDGVLSSSAIPFFFKPWLTQRGEYYWDGAVRESTPIRKALELGATNVVVVLTGPAPWSHEPSLRPQSYGLVIEHVVQIADVEGITGDAGDFRATVRINNQRDAWVTSRYRENDRNLFPRWTFFSVNGDIEIRIDDYEDNPDHCDVSPVRGRKNLQIRLVDGEISGDVQGRAGDLLTARGNGDGDDVEIQFRIVAISEGPSAYLGDSALSVTPVRRVLQAFGQMTAEMAEGDMAVLDTLDSLAEVAAEVGEDRVIRGVRSFPLPRDAFGQPYFLPRYDVVDAPLVLGEVTDFDPDLIRLNLQIGEAAAKYTRIDFLDRREAPRRGPYLNPTQDPDISDERLEQLKRTAILEILQDEIERLSAEPNQDYARRSLERESERLGNARIVPARHSPRLGPEFQDGLLTPPPHANQCVHDPCPGLLQRVRSLEASIERLQRRLSEAGSAMKAQLLNTIEKQQRRLDAAREDYRRQCGRSD